MAHSSLRPDDNVKTLDPTFAKLAELYLPQTVTLKKPYSPLDGLSATLTKEAQGFNLSYDDPSFYHLQHESGEDLVLQGKIEVRVPSIYFNGANGSHVTVAPVHEFFPIDFDKVKPAFHRLVLPLEKSIDFTFSIACLGYRSERVRSTECIRAQFDTCWLDLYIYRDDERYYLVLDSSAELTFTSFSHFCFAALVATGYITGKFVQDEAVHFCYDTPALETPVIFGLKRYRKSISTIFIPIYANTHGYIRGNHEEANKEQATLRVLSEQEFSRLCQRAADCYEFIAILLLMMEASRTSLTIMPAAFSVALESMTDLLVTENDAVFAPILDKALAKELRNALQTVVDQFAPRIGAEGALIVKNKINNLNSPTNRNQLIKPFELLNISLTPVDIAAIEHRNDFLHGRITELPDANGEPKKVSREVSSMEIYYISLRLYTLVSMLILKYIGYDGRIVNQPKIQQHNYTDPAVLAQLATEGYFRQI